MKKITAVLISLCMVIALCITGCGSQVKVTDTAGNPINVKSPKYVFYMIGDGLGAAQRQLTEYYVEHTDGDNSEKLLINTLPVAGMNTTHSEDSLVTDSAAAGTALATGSKTNNGEISMTVDGQELPTVMEKAMSEKGMATGLITTTRLTHATPATFAAHNMDRDDENGIAVDYLESGVDFFAGGGLRHFIPADFATDEVDAAGQGIKSKREDDRNLFQEFEAKGYTTFFGREGAASFKDYQPAAGDKVFAAFTYTHIPYELDRINNDEITVPSLAEMTEKAVDVLSADKDGFFLMVEGGRIDHACHANDALGAIYDTIAFDDAVRVAYDFYMEHPKETLVLVVGDHETGGLGMGFGDNYFINYDALNGDKVSVEDVLQYVYDGDRAAFYTYIAENCGLTDLNKDEKALIEKAMDDIAAAEAAGETPVGYSYYNPAAIAVTHILSERANVQWTTYAHSGTAIPMSAIGNSAEAFGGYKDNTEIGLSLFDIMGL